MRARSALVIAALAMMALGCHRDHGKPGPPPPDKAVFGEMVPRDDLDFLPYLAMARAIVTHKEVPPAPAPALPPQRAFVTMWLPGALPIVATGLGDSLATSVAEAARGVDSQIGGLSRDEGVRIEIDLVRQVEPSAITNGMRDHAAQVGLWGYAAMTKESKLGGYILPGEILTERDVDVNSLENNDTVKLFDRRIVMRVARRAHVDESAVDQMGIYRFSTTAVVESSPPGRAIKLVRTMPPHQTSLTADELLAATRAAADYIERVTSDQGRFIYDYKAQSDEPTKEYGWIRHAGATYSLLEAYGEFKEPTYIAKAERALEALKGRLKTTPNGSYLSDNADEEQQKVGGSGLAMIAFVRHAQLTGQSTYLETMQDMARLIVHQQYPDGHFRANADVMVEDEAARGKKLKKEVTYFAGEAVLGLIRLYAIDPNPQWLAAARKGADYLIDVRDGHEPESSQIHDHWLAYALLDLYRVTKDPRYAEHVWKIARAIISKERTPANAQYPDYVGAFYELGETTPTSTRLEALSAALELSRYMGKDDTWLREPAMETAVFMRGQQLDKDSDYFVKNPAKALGGVRESLLSSDVRIDYPQHALCGWLRFARFLRDPAYGKAPASGADAGH